MDDASSGVGEKHKSSDNLLSKFSHEIERDTAEVRVADEVVEIEGE